MTKIGLVYSFKESLWFSCIKIISNLIKSYEALDNTELVHINYGEADFKNPESTVEKILESKLDKLIIVDHAPHPYPLFKNLLGQSPTFSPEIIFHIFGDMTLYLHEWMNLGNLVQNKKVKFFCASESQVKLVSGALSNQSTHVKRVPFPVDQNEFSYNLKQNIKIREYLNIEEDSKIFLYTGRLSLQKNIVETVSVFKKALDERCIPENSYLVLIGDFDSIGFPFGDQIYLEGEYFRIFDRYFSKLDIVTKNKIKLLGKLDNNLLKDFYMQADIFVSFSTYHDEDYGMSIAEAGMCGLPLSLTMWGGFNSFLHTQGHGGVETTLTDLRPSFKIDEALKNLSDIFNKNINREELSKKFHNEYSLGAVNKILKNYLSCEVDKFSGFNPQFEEIARKSAISSTLLFDAKNKKMNRYYKWLYKSYVG